MYIYLQIYLSVAYLKVKYLKQCIGTQRYNYKPTYVVLIYSIIYDWEPTLWSLGMQSGKNGEQSSCMEFTI